MTDDIVTRLRKWAKRADRWNYENETFPELREAADEIERLRAELEGAHKAMWDDTLIPIADALGIKLYDDLGNPLRQFQVVDAILKAVRGE